MDFNGKHLTVDAVVQGPSIEKLFNSSFGNTLCDKIVQNINMTLILPPITVKFPHSVCEMERTIQSLTEEGLSNSETCKSLKSHLHKRHTQEYGYSTICMIAESHISFHTFPEENFFTFDCYSCKEFDETRILKLLKEDFPGIKYNINIIKRYIPQKTP